MPSQDRSDRSAAAAIAAHTKWARCDDPAAATAAARTKFLERFEDEVDPDRRLDPAERARRAAHARKAYFARLALKSARARRRSGDAEGGGASDAA